MLSADRTTFRALQLQGVVETRPGAGTFVAADAPAGEVPHDASPSAVLEARAQLEPAVARLAAQRAQPDPAAENLLQAMEAVGDPAEPGARVTWSAYERLFHRQLAALT